MAAPVDHGPEWGTIADWAGVAWAVITVIIGAISGLLWRLYADLSRRITEVEKKQEAVDHDLKGVRQSLEAAEKLAERRHDDNRADRAEDKAMLADIRDSLSEEFKYLRTKIDRLTERNQ